ncbi:hypothetical protein [Burkholderia ubonensis]|uniref:hypothetical protein n=1 Tax=Burkholderia ubonensis TaxID=101571 RepID=UPI00076CE14F|nr:hypothetical protein [Burkholderia ubonensis]KVP17363.1 hypothetical protein WJ84_03795 [Burkholderia ubonensis]
MTMQFVLVERTASSDAQVTARSRLEEAGARIIRWRGHIGLVEFEGTAAELVSLAGGLPGWLVSEQRVYRLARVPR